MDKKSVEKKTIIREVVKPVAKEVVHVNRNEEVERILIDNFVSLQKVMAHLSGKFDELTAQLSKLLQLFEVSAKTLAEKDFDIEKNNRENAKILEKIENVLEQNKTIARGLTLMHDKINEPAPQQSGYYPSQQYPPQLAAARAQTQQQTPSFSRPAQKTSGGVSEEFHRPISSNEQ